MLFNSVNFIYFLALIFLLYWLLNEKFGNILLLIASYYFYSCWDWRFLFLLIFSTFFDFYTGIKMSESSNIGKKKFWFWLSIIINIGFLGVFKYFNFFTNSFAELLSNIGFRLNPWSINVILPVGISFYTFHSLSYVIDIYKGRINAERNFIDYALFVSFFPLLVAGPIERATHLLPQIQSKKEFNYLKAVDGLRQILWGLFKKVVIADNCAYWANIIFYNPTDYSGSTLVVGAVLFAFQIYGDFSGYSDIALGTARLFGIELLKNFSFPYFSRDIAEFWRRWHISLSTWFRDYLYIPLGGSKGGLFNKIRNTFIIFLVSGFWHGANWTFIIWGGLNALYFMPLLMLNRNRNNLDIVASGKHPPSLKDSAQILLTFSLTVFAWIFFRAENVTHAISIVSKIFSTSLLSIPQVRPLNVFILIFIFIVIEWIGREDQYALQSIGKNWKRGFRYAFYYAIIVTLFGFAGNSQEFIYFQF